MFVSAVCLVLMLAATHAGPLLAAEGDDVLLPVATTHRVHGNYSRSRASPYRTCMHEHRQLPHRGRKCMCQLHRANSNVEDLEQDSLRMRSLCRWIFDYDYLETRRPACIRKVVGCINTVHGQTINQCEMVRYPLPIQRRSGSLWVDDIVMLPVACALARPPIHHIPYQPPASGLPYNIN